MLLISDWSSWLVLHSSAGGQAVVGLYKGEWAAEPFRQAQDRAG